MEKLAIYFLKLLKKVKLLAYFNFIFAKTFNGRRIKIPILNGTGLTNMVLKKEWLDSIIEAFLNKESKTFVDVGVNIGQTLIRLKTFSPEIHYLGFEPNSACASYTNRLIKINRFADCVIQNAALSSKVDTLVLEKTLDTDSRASLISGLRPNYFTDKESVMALDYQSFYLDEQISLVKIDVEGAEYEVIKGMEKAIIQYQPIIVCEVLDSHNAGVLDFTQQRATMLCEMLHSWNYKIIQLHTSDKTSRLISFQKIDTIKIMQWNTESNDLNDYLFYPESIENKVIENLNIICG